MLAYCQIQYEKKLMNFALLCKTYSNLTLLKHEFQGKVEENLNKFLQGLSIQAGIILQEMQLLQLEVVPVVALSFSFQHLENRGPKQQVREVGQSQKYCPAHFDRDQLEPCHQLLPAPRWTQT